MYIFIKNFKKLQKDIVELLWFHHQINIFTSQTQIIKTSKPSWGWGICKLRNYMRESISFKWDRQVIINGIYRSFRKVKLQKKTNLFGCTISNTNFILLKQAEWLYLKQGWSNFMISYSFLMLWNSEGKFLFLLTSVIAITIFTENL